MKKTSFDVLLCCSLCFTQQIEWFGFWMKKTKWIDEEWSFSEVLLPCDLSNTCPHWVSSSLGSSPAPASGAPSFSPCWVVSHLSSLAWGVHVPAGGRRETSLTHRTDGGVLTQHQHQERFMFYKNALGFFVQNGYGWGYLIKMICSKTFRERVRVKKPWDAQQRWRTVFSYLFI